MDITIGIWGSRRAGKTTFLLQLFDQLSKSNNWEVGADIKSTKYISDLRRESLDRGFFPPATEKATGYNSYTYVLRQKKHGNLINKDVINLKFVDAPGEWYEDLEGETEPIPVISPPPLNPDPKLQAASLQKLSSDDVSNVVKYLHGCDGVIYLLDPFYEKNSEKGDAYQTLLQKLFNLVNSYGLVNGESPNRITHKQYTVFAVTKADNPDIYKRTLEFDGIFGLVNEKLNHRNSQSEEASIIWFKNYFELDPSRFDDQKSKEMYLSATLNHRCQFFAISSIGVYLNKSNSYQSPVENKKFKMPDAANPPLNSGSIGMNEGGNNHFPPPPPPHPSAHISGQQIEEKIVIPKGNISRPFYVIEPLEWIIQGVILEKEKSNG